MSHPDIDTRIQDTRIQEVEDARFRLREMPIDNPTFKDKIERFKKQNLEHYSKYFGNVTIGVHGRELPKFYNEEKHYWKNMKGYQNMPLYQSAKYMQEDK